MRYAGTVSVRMRSQARDGSLWRIGACSGTNPVAALENEPTSAPRRLPRAPPRCRVSILRVFISYRRLDAQSAARQLAESLKLRLGSEDVFFDTLDITAGVEWRTDTVQRVQESDVVLAVIGASLGGRRRRPHQAEPRDRTDEDVVRLEIQAAFAHGVIVIPGARRRSDDARSRGPAAALQAARRRPGADPAPHLVGSRRRGPRRGHRPSRRGASAVGAAAGSARQAAPPPGRTDAERVARYLSEGWVVTVLGSSANAVDRDAPWEHGDGSLPDTTELARHLARQFRTRVGDRRPRPGLPALAVRGRGRPLPDAAELRVGGLHAELRAPLPRRLPRAAARPGRRALPADRHHELRHALERAFDEARSRTTSRLHPRRGQREVPAHPPHGEAPS